MLCNYAPVFVVLVGCFGLENVTNDDVSDVADCYEQTIVVDDHYAIILDKDCMDFALLSAAPKIALESESIENAEEVPAPEAEAPETEVEATETEVSPQYPCPIEDLGDWTLLVTLARNNFSLGSFRVPDEEIDLITQAFVDQKDFLFIIYEPAVIVDPRWNRGSDRAGGSQEARYYLENPGLLSANALTPHFYTYHFVDPNAHWFSHWDKVRDLTKSGFTVSFDTSPFLEPEKSINPRKFEWSPKFGTSLDGFVVDGAGAPDINEDVLLSIYIR